MAAVENFKYVNWIKSINQLVQICLCISFIIGLNYFANNLYWRSDLTRDHIYSLSPESLAYIRQIDKPIKIIVPPYQGPPCHRKLFPIHKINHLSHALLPVQLKQ